MVTCCIVYFTKCEYFYFTTVILLMNRSLIFSAVTHDGLEFILANFERNELLIEFVALCANLTKK